MSPLLLLPWILQIFLQWKCVQSAGIEELECPLPDVPQSGGYGPRQDYYSPGDVIHYFCDTDTEMGGNFFSRCEDNGDWVGNTPVCDSPARFSSSTQSSTADPSHENDSESARDGARITCSSTLKGAGGFWMGVLKTPGQAIRVKLFLPKVYVDYDILMVKTDGSEMSCGKQKGKIDRYQWWYYNCPEPHNTGVAAIKIKSLSNAPVQLCEVVTHVLTDPTCIDPHYVVDNGHFRLSRKTAVLICAKGYSPSRDKRLDCVRTGQWNRKQLYCIDREYEVERDGPRSPDAEPLAGGQ